MPLRPSYPDVALELRDRLALERTHLANERTLLAYLRTGMALVVAGFSLIEFSRANVFVWAGGALVPIGLALVGIGFWRYVRRRRFIRADMRSALRPTDAATAAPALPAD